jgi:hypothetical protein
MAAEAWQTGAAPRIFVTRALDTAARKLEEQRQGIAARRRPAEARSEVLERLPVIRDAVVVARDAVQRTDRPALRSAVRTLAREEATLHRSGRRGSSS